MGSKLKTEFEEWAVTEGLTLHGKDGRYLKEIQSAWMAWQASREVLCVELPEEIKPPNYEEDDEWYNLAIRHVRVQLDKAGVKYK